MTEEEDGVIHLLVNDVLDAHLAALTCKCGHCHRGFLAGARATIEAMGPKTDPPHE